MARGLCAGRSTARSGFGQEGGEIAAQRDEGEEDVSERRKTKGEDAYQPERTPQDDTFHSRRRPAIAPNQP